MQQASGEGRNPIMVPPDPPWPLGFRPFPFAGRPRDALVMMFSSRISARQLAILIFQLGLLALPAVVASRTSARYDGNASADYFTDICSIRPSRPTEIVVKPGIS